MISKRPWNKMLSLVAPSRHRSIGFADRTAGVRSCKPTRPFLDGPSGEFAVP